MKEWKKERGEIKVHRKVKQKCKILPFIFISRMENGNGRFFNWKLYNYHNTLEENINSTK